MEIVSIHRAQVFQRFVPDEVRPEQDIYLPRLYELAREKYGFINASDITKASAEGVKFQGGKVVCEGREIAVESMSVHSDGIIVACRSTSDGDLVVDDAVEWGISFWGWRRPKTIIPRVYTSWIIVDFHSSTSTLFRNFAKLQKLIADAHEEAGGARLDFEVAKLSIAADPKSLPQFTNTEYLIDRRQDTPFSQNRFFCSAPLRTDAHLRLLEKLERLLAA
jgi:hypothetical protein